MTPLEEHEFRSALEGIAPLRAPEGITMSVIQRSARRRRWAIAGTTVAAGALVALGSVALPPLLTTPRDAVPAAPPPSAASPTTTPSGSVSPATTPPGASPSVPTNADVITLDGFGVFRLGVTAESLHAAGWTDPTSNACTERWGQSTAFTKAYPDTDLDFDDADTLVHLGIGDPALRTGEGVGVGSTLAELQAAYGPDLAMIRPYVYMASPDELGPASPTIVAGDRFLLFWFDDHDTVQRVMVGTLYEHRGSRIPILGRPC